MRLGFSDFAFDGDISSLLEFAQAHDLKLIQISLDNKYYFPENFSQSARQKLFGLLHELDIGLCLHGPSDLPLINRHEIIRSAARQRFFEFIDMAIEMGAEYFIFHPGRQAYYSISTKKVFFVEQRFPKEVSIWFVDSIKQILKQAQGKLKLCIENTNFLSSQFFDIIRDLCENHGLGLVWDVGHTENLPAAKRDFMIKFFRDNLKHVKLGHLHDYHENSGHKAIGSGKVNVATYLEIFNTLGTDIILEIFPEKELLQSLSYLENAAQSLKTETPVKSQ